MTSIAESPTQRHAEMSVVFYYLYLGRDSVMMAGISPEHFVAEPVLGDIWRKCYAIAQSGKTFDFLEASRPYHEAYQEISDHSSVPARPIIEQAERTMRQGAAVHQVMLDLMDWKEAADSGEVNAIDLHSQFAELSSRFQVGEEVTGEWHGTVAKRVIAQYLQPDVDRVIPMPILGDRCRGWKFKKLYLVGGITSNHKTTFALNSAYLAAESKFPTLYWTLEDDNDDICERTIAAQAKFMTLDDFEAGRPTKGRGSPAKLADLKSEVDNNGDVRLMYIEEKLPLDRLLAEITRLVYRHSFRMVVIDFLQLIDSSNSRLSDTDTQKTSVQALAALAKRLNIAIICVVQLTQEATKRSEDGEPPRSGDIRGGSAIAQAAYGIIMTHRPADARTRSDGTAQIQLVVRKWKRAKRGVVNCWVSGEHDRFSEG